MPEFMKLRVYSLIKLQQIPKVSLPLLVFLLHIKKPNVGLIENHFDSPPSPIFSFKRENMKLGGEGDGKDLEGVEGGSRLSSKYMRFFKIKKEI